MSFQQRRKSSGWIPHVRSKWCSGMLLLIPLLYLALLEGVIGHQTGFTVHPSKPMVAFLGNNVTFIWKFHLSHFDQERLTSVTFGKWSHDGTFTELKVLCANRQTPVVLSTNTSYWKCLSKSRGSYSAFFRLVNVTMRDKATYGCRLSFGAHRNALTDYVQLLIKAPARITHRSTSLKQLKVKQNQPISLTCDVTGEPPPSVAWIQEGHVLQNNTWESTYVIERATVNMTGVYKCIASNPLGSDVREILLIVTSCVKESDDESSETKSHASKSYGSKHAIVSMLAVGSVMFLILLAYCFFNCAGRTAQKNGAYRRIQKDSERTNNHVSDWRSFSDNGDKI